jgi:hypothetical protein
MSNKYDWSRRLAVDQTRNSSREVDAYVIASLGGERNKKVLGVLRGAREVRDVTIRHDSSIFDNLGQEISWPEDNLLKSRGSRSKHEIEPPPFTTDRLCGFGAPSHLWMSTETVHEYDALSARSVWKGRLQLALEHTLQ